MIGIDNPSILEVGCGSGYYAQVLSHLVGSSIRYTGLDYSPAMIALARSQQPQQIFIRGDATDLSLPQSHFDIVINVVSLRHIVLYEKSISEAYRVARSYCIMHSAPLLQRRATTYLQKKAYGQMTVEIIFNQEQLFALLQQSGREICSVINSIEYDLCHILGEPTTTKTIICRKC